MATEMLDGGVAIAVVSHRLAHARASTTLNVYAHAIPGGDRAAAQQLSERLKLARLDQANDAVTLTDGSLI
jgi:integrase